jgi:hypothetical protein
LGYKSEPTVSTTTVVTFNPLNPELNSIW